MGQHRDQRRILDALSDEEGAVFAEGFGRMVQRKPSRSKLGCISPAR
jgi:hypothetical protein